MQKWEYLVTYLNDDNGEKLFLNALNEMGNFGWELCQVTGENKFLKSNNYIFKRQKCS